MNIIEFIKNKKDFFSLQEKINKSQMKSKEKSFLVKLKTYLSSVFIASVNFIIPFFVLLFTQKIDFLNIENGGVFLVVFSLIFLITGEFSSRTIKYFSKKNEKKFLSNNNESSFHSFYFKLKNIDLYTFKEEYDFIKNEYNTLNEREKKIIEDNELSNYNYNIEKNIEKDIKEIKFSKEEQNKILFFIDEHNINIDKEKIKLLFRYHNEDEKIINNKAIKRI